MKILFLSIVAVGTLVTEVLAQAPAVGPGAVKLGEVEVEGIKSPEYQIVGGPQKRSKIGTWLEVEIGYETKIDDIDELSFAYQILVEGKLLDGSVTYVNIPKGKDHFAVMYIAPRSLEKLTNGKTLNPANINVWVTVSRQGEVLDAPAAYRPAPIPNLPHQPGLVLNKNETPFAPLFYDR